MRQLVISPCETFLEVRPATLSWLGSRAAPSLCSSRQESYSLRGDHRTSIAFSSAVSAPWLELFWFHLWPRQALPAGTRERFWLYWFFSSLPMWNSLYSIGFERQTRSHCGLPKSNGFHLAPITLPSHKRHFSTWPKNYFYWAHWAFLSHRAAVVEVPEGVRLSLLAQASSWV